MSTLAPIAVTLRGGLCLECNQVRLATRLGSASKTQDVILFLTNEFVTFPVTDLLSICSVQPVEKAHSEPVKDQSDWEKEGEDIAKRAQRICTSPNAPDGRYE